jgi:hypothetical protein
MQDQSVQAARAIKYLEYIRARPTLYVGPDLLAMMPFLEGFQVACVVLGFMTNDYTVRQAIWKKHRWHYSPRGWLVMQDRGLDAAAIADALLHIEIDVWKHLYQVTDEMVANSELLFNQAPQYPDTL